MELNETLVLRFCDTSGGRPGYDWLASRVKLTVEVTVLADWAWPVAKDNGDRGAPMDEAGVTLRIRIVTCDISLKGAIAEYGIDEVLRVLGQGHKMKKDVTNG